MEQLLVSRQPLLIFLEEPPGAQGPRLSALGQTWLGLVVQSVQVGVIPDAMLVPVAITYDLVPDAPRDVYHVSPAPGDSKWTPSLERRHIVFSGQLPLGLELSGECKGILLLQSSSCGTSQGPYTYPVISSSKDPVRDFSCYG